MCAKTAAQRDWAQMNRIRDIKRRAEKATKGPWFATDTEKEPQCVEVEDSAWEYRGLSGTDGDGKWTVSDSTEFAGWRHDGGYGGYGITKTNAEFIAHAREDIPLLLAKLEEAARLLRRSERLACFMDCQMEGLHPKCICVEIAAFLNEIDHG